MSNDTNARPLIIKRKKVSGGDGHHGGAWKVAMLPFPLLYRRRFRAKGHRVGADPFNRHSDACGPSCRATPHEAVRGRPSRRSMNNVLNRPIAWVSFGENLR